MKIGVINHMSDDAVYATQGLTFMGGSDEKGRYVCWGPTLREVYAIMILMQGAWVPYKIYKNKKPKTLKHAKQHLAQYRKKYNPTKFKLEEIWETVPANEMEKTYYEDEKEILSDIETTLGLNGPGEFVVGLGRADRTGIILVGDRIDGHVNRVLDFAKEGPFQFNVAKVPVADREQHCDNGFGVPAVEGDPAEEIEQSQHPGNGRDGDRQEGGQEPEAGDNSVPEVHDIGTEHIGPDNGVNIVPTSDAELGLETVE